MARYSDASPYCRDWTNRKLIAELRRTANLTDFGDDMPGEKRPATPDVIRDKTRLYRNTWMNPLIDEIERRFIKPARDTMKFDVVI